MTVSLSRGYWKHRAERRSVDHFERLRPLDY
jgi:hypothetical protein